MDSFFGSGENEEGEDAAAAAEDGTGAAAGDDDVTEVNGTTTHGGSEGSKTRSVILEAGVANGKTEFTFHVFFLFQS